MNVRSWQLAILLLALLPATTPQAADTSAVRDWIERELASGTLHAASVAEIHGNQMESRGFGRRSEDDPTAPDGSSQFQIGSITKVYTHLLLLELEASGALSPGQTLGEAIAGFKPRNPAVAGITLRSLSTHTSGLPRQPANLDLSNGIDPYADYDADDLREALLQTRERQKLGSHYTYSNFGVGTLGWVLGQVDGKGYEAALIRRVIEPLDLAQTALRPGDNAIEASAGGKKVTAWRFDALAGAGAVWGSVDDLARLLQAYLGTHPHRLRHDLAADLRVVVPQAGAFAVTPVWHVARAGEHAIYWHNGGTAGFHSFVGFRPDSGRGVAILTSGDADPTAVGLKSLGAVAGAATPVKIDGTILGQYQLSPELGIGVLEIDGALVAQATGQPAFTLHAAGDDWYAFGDIDASLHFLRDPAAVTALELAQGGRLQRAERVADAALAAARREITLDPRTYDDYVGSYAFAPAVALTVKRSENGIQARLPGQPWFPLHARARDHFFYKVVDAELRFERDADGKVKTVVLIQAGMEQRAERQP
jgi:CubicO group peptidase (beta-lactamase class C family)